MNISRKRRLEILAVDDEPTVLRSIKMLLEHDGHLVHAVECGKAALLLMEHIRFDLVITDFSMPDMQGDELVARIRQMFPNQPIVMATAFAEEFKVFGQPGGTVDALLLKPFSMIELREAIDQVLPPNNPDGTSGLPLTINPPTPENHRPSPEP